MDYWLAAKRIRLADDGLQDEDTSDENDSRSSTPDSMLFRDLQDPNQVNRCAVGINHYTDPTEQNILQWQEAQLARCITENTVNRVVESYIDMFNDDSIRLEQSTIQMAIRMAIIEHGVQPIHEPNIPASLHRPESAQPVVNNNQLVMDSTSGISSLSASSTRDGESSSIAKPTTDPPFVRSDYDDDDELEAVEDFEYEDFSDTNSEPDHSNFLEAAVAAAIQKKGLSSSHPTSETG